MTYAFLRLLYAVYFIVWAIIIINVASELLFGKRKLSVRVVECGRRLILVPVWPLLFFTYDGISRIFTYVDERVD